LVLWLILACNATSDDPHRRPAVRVPEC